MTRTNRLLLLLVVLAASVSAFWFLAMEPKRDEASRLAEQIAAEQAELDAARDQVAAYEQARASYPANYATVARLGKAVPADDDVRSILVQIDAAAKRSGVEFRVIDVGKGNAVSAGTPAQPAASTANVIPGATADAAGFSTLPMSFSFRGSYFELSALFTRLERFVSVTNRRIDVTGRLLLLQSISLVPDGDGFPQMRAQVTAASYLVPAPAAVPGGAAAQPSGAAAAVPPAGSAASGAPSTSATAPGAVR